MIATGKIVCACDSLEDLEHPYGLSQAPQLMIWGLRKRAADDLPYAEKI